MRIDVLTIFPEFFTQVFDFGIIRRAKLAGIVEIEIHEPYLVSDLELSDAMDFFTLLERMQQTRMFAARADRFTDYLSWLGVLVGIGAIFLAVLAIQAIRQFAQARLNLAEILREAETRFQVAVIDRAQLAHQGAPGPLALAPGKACHASDH